MKSDYRTRALKFLKTIFPYIKNDLYSIDDVEYHVNRYISEHPSRKIEVNCGSARIALITSDYVIKWDYDDEAIADIGGCEKECEIYNNIKKEGYAYLFAESTLINYCGINFEIMPRVRAIGVNCHPHDICELLNGMEIDWLKQKGLMYDLHHWNWGIKYNKPVIIDYAYVEYD